MSVCGGHLFIDQQKSKTAAPAGSTVSLGAGAAQTLGVRKARFETQDKECLNCQFLPLSHHSVPRVTPVLISSRLKASPSCETVLTHVVQPLGTQHQVHFAAAIA